MNTTMYSSEYADMFRSEESLWWYRGTRDIIQSALSRYCPSPATILDAGCGTGKIMAVLSGHHYTVRGIDVSDIALTYCRKRGLTDVRFASVTDIPHDANTFDAILHIDVLGVLSRQQARKAIEEFYRVLKPGGHIILQCAALEWLRSQHDTVTNIKIRYDKQQLMRMFASKKWRVVKIRYRVFLLFAPIMFLKLIKNVLYRLGSPATTDQYILPGSINGILAAIQFFENKLFWHINMPIGSSLFLIAEKK